MTFLTASSFYSIFSQVSITFNSTVALQVGFLKHLGDTVHLDLVCLSFFMSFQTDWMMIRSDQISVWSTGCCQTFTGLLQLMAKWMFGNVNGYFLLTQQKIEITDLKPFFLTGENTSGLKLLHSTVYRVEKVKTRTGCTSNEWLPGFCDCRSEDLSSVLEYWLGKQSGQDFESTLPFSI